MRAAAIGTLLLLLLVLTTPTVSFADSILDVGLQSSPYTGNSRGFWFTAPMDFWITGLGVPTDASTELQSIELLRLDTVPPTYPLTTNAFTSLGYWQGVPGTDFIDVNFTIATGDVIGVLGVRGNVNSYGAQPYLSSIGGMPVTLRRFGFQDQLENAQAYDVWTEGGGSIGRVDVRYSMTSVRGAGTRDSRPGGLGARHRGRTPPHRNSAK